MVRVGGWLFGHRGWLVAVPVVGLAWTTRPLHIGTGIGLGMLFLGNLVRIWAVGHMGATARVRKPVVRKLIYTGPYELSRNPLYLANIGMLAGLGLATHGLFGFSLVLFSASVFYGFIVQYEEDFLDRKLGEIYRSYRNRVPRWMGEAAPVHAAAPKGLLSERVEFALKTERSTMVSVIIVTILVLIRALEAG